MTDNEQRKHDAIGALRDMVMIHLAGDLPAFEFTPVCEFAENGQEHLLVEHDNKVVLITVQEADSETLQGMVKRVAESAGIPLPASLLN